MNIWSLKDREPVVIGISFGEVEEYSIKIIWSPKVGLRYKKVFEDYDKAMEYANKILRSKYININDWKKNYNPGKYYLDTYVDLKKG